MLTLKNRYILARAIARARMGEPTLLYDTFGRHLKVQPTDTVETLWARATTPPSPAEIQRAAIERGSHVVIEELSFGPGEAALRIA